MKKKTLDFIEKAIFGIGVPFVLKELMENNHVVNEMLTRINETLKSTQRHKEKGNKKRPRRTNENPR